MIKTYRFHNLIALLNTSNGKIAYYTGNTKQIDINNIEGFSVFDVPDFSKNDYSTFYLGFNISNTCNLKCKYCFRNKENQKKMSIDFIEAAIIKFLQNTDNCKKLFIDLSGDGEPLLEKKLLGQVSSLCLELGKKYDIEIIPMLICNGTLLDENMVTFLQEKLILFGVSLDGTKNNHDRNRIDAHGNGTYDLISRNLLKIEHNDFVGVSMTLAPDFADDIVECYKEMLRHAPTIAIRFKRNIDLQDESFYRAFYRIIQGYKELLELLKEQIVINDYKLLFAILNGDDYFGKIFIRVFTGCRIDSPCEGLVARFTCTNQGFYPCSPASDLKMFKTDKMDRIEEFHEAIRNSKHYCKDCHSRYYCGGECPIVFTSRKKVDKGLCEIKMAFVDLAIELVCFLLNNQEKYDQVGDFILMKLKRINVA